MFRHRTIMAESSRALPASAYTFSGGQFDWPPLTLVIDPMKGPS
jgi:hypothetical protein